MKTKKFSTDNWGSLFVVATPIGNMDDITFRAVRVLSFVDLVLAEDTRIARRLFFYYGIKTKLEALHEHNELLKLDEFIIKIKLSKNIALISNAGTPLISDPGFKLVRKAIKHSIKIVPIPGVSAIITSLSVAGIASDSFIFGGFVTKKRRFQILKVFGLEKQTIVFYESPKRILFFFYDILRMWGDRYIVLSREMTKIHEEFIRGEISILLVDFDIKSKLKGECTILISGNTVINLFLDKGFMFNRFVISKILCGVLSISQLSDNLFKFDKKLSLKKIYNLVTSLGENF